MKIPKLVKVGGRVFEVKYPYVFQERSDIAGRTDEGKGIIFIADVNAAGNKYSQLYVEQVFWHEIFHIIDWTYCCNKIGINTDKESMIEGLAIGLLQVLQDNFKELRVKESKNYPMSNPLAEN